MTSRKWSLAARQLTFVGALLVGCQSPDASREKRMRGSGDPAQMPSWEASKQSEVGMPDIEPETYMAAGRLHETQGRLTRAAAQYRAALQIKPDSAEAHGRLGVVLCHMRQFKEADAELAQAIRLAPNQAHLYNNLGFSYLAQGRWAEAEQQFNKALQLKPDFARAHVNLAMVLAQQEKYEAAMQHFRLVVPLEDAWFNIGLMYQSKTRPAEAARAFKTALKLNPKLSAAQQCLDKLPPDLVAQAGPFANIASLAPAPEMAAPAQPAAPVESVASATQPSAIEQMIPAQIVEGEMSEEAPIGEMESPETAAVAGEPTPGSPEEAEAPIGAKRDVADGLEDQVVPQGPSEAQGIAPEYIEALLSAGFPGAPVLGLPSSQPENDMIGWPSFPTMSSTSQPSTTLVEEANMEMEGLFVIRRTPIDLTAEPAEDTDEIVLSSRPLMPVPAPTGLQQTTQPSTDAPTPEELRTIVGALLEMGRSQQPEMPKPYGSPTTRPATTTAPQSQPAPGQSDAGFKEAADEDGSLADFSEPSWYDFESIFAPGETFGSADPE